MSPHQAEAGGAGFRAEDLLDVSDRVFRGEAAAVAVFHVRAQSQCPGAQIVARLPAFEQMGRGDVVVAGLGEELADLGMTLPGGTKLLSCALSIASSRTPMRRGAQEFAAANSCLSLGM